MIAALLASALFASAAPTAAGAPLTLEEVLEAARASNARLPIAAGDVASAQAREAQAGAGRLSAGSHGACATTSVPP
ncbi:MAG: hypothetical protein NVS4B10_07550 [Myxococcales bacterium]